MTTPHDDRAGSPLSRVEAMLRIDVRGGHRVPTMARAVLATVGAVAGSLAADALLVVVGQAAFPTTRGYQHFQFGDYATLTIIGVVAACIGWPLACWLSEQPRWLVSRAAVLVTIVLLLPDVAILIQGQPARAVGVLMVMHVAIAVVTYGALVFIGQPTRRTPIGGVDLHVGTSDETRNGI
jgi:hypothetical protein